MRIRMANNVFQQALVDKLPLHSHLWMRTQGLDTQEKKPGYVAASSSFQLSSSTI